jgi:hypothetical protein
VRETDELIAGALREMADRAVAPPPMANAAWRAGRRRRRFGIAMTSAVGTAGIIALAVLLPLTLAGGPSPSGPSTGLLPVSLRQPIQFRQVAKITRGPCPAHSSGLYSRYLLSCVHLAKAGMILTQGTAGWVDMPQASSYSVTIQLTPADRSRFAALTRKVTGLPRPRNQLAIIVGGRLIAAPTIEGPLTGGFVPIVGIPTRSQAENLIRGLPHPGWPR